MATKTVEEIKDEIVTLVKSQGNQGAISLSTVLDDITELAGEGGGGGGSTPNVISISIDGGGWVIDNPDDLSGFAEKAEQGELVMLKMNAFDELSNPQAVYVAAQYSKSSSASTFSSTGATVANGAVVGTTISIDCIAKTASVTTATYPS